MEISRIGSIVGCSVRIVSVIAIPMCSSSRCGKSIAPDESPNNRNGMDQILQCPAGATTTVNLPAPTKGSLRPQLGSVPNSGLGQSNNSTWFAL